MSEISLKEQVRCVGRELGLRRNVYPKWIAKGRMTQEQADREIATMEAVYETLKRLEAESARVRPPSEQPDAEPHRGSTPA